MKNNTFLMMACLFFTACGFDKDVATDLQATLSSLSERLNPTQNFDISPLADTAIAGRHGTKIFISAGSFEYEDGRSPSDKITISLKEVYTYPEMILNRLSTTADGHLLGTSGMIHIQAECEGQELKLKSGFPLKINFKNINNAPLMRTFLGAEDATGINWQLDKGNMFDTLIITEQAEEIIPLDYGVDSLVTQTVTYKVVGQDTLERVQSSNGGFVLGDDSAIEAYHPIYATQLNWINCDYFVNSTDNIDVLVALPPSSAAVCYLIFKDYKAIMSSWEVKEGYRVFRNVPRGSAVTIYSIDGKEKAFLTAALDKTLTIDHELITLDYQKSSLEAITVQMKGLE